MIRSRWRSRRNRQNSTAKDTGDTPASDQDSKWSKRRMRGSRKGFLRKIAERRKRG